MVKAAGERKNRTMSAIRGEEEQNSASHQEEALQMTDSDHTSHHENPQTLMQRETLNRPSTQTPVLTPEKSLRGVKLL